LYAKNTKIVETLMKIDPTKPFFFENVEDIQVELEAIVRNEEGPTVTSSTAKRVHYAATHDTMDIGVGGGAQSGNEYDEDDRDDDQAYLRYQATGQYDGYAGAGGDGADENLMGLLNLQPQSLPGLVDGALAAGDGGRQSDDSTDAVANGHRAGGSGPNSADEMGIGDDGNGDGQPGACPRCGAINDASGAFACAGCGVWLGGPN